jgi:hypothetical protein
VLDYQVLELLRCRYRQASNWASPQTALLERDGESKAESDFLGNLYKAVFFLGSIVDRLQIIRHKQGQEVVKPFVMFQESVGAPTIAQRSTSYSPLEIWAKTQRSKPANSVTPITAGSSSAGQLFSHMQSL